MCLVWWHRQEPGYNPFNTEIDLAPNQKFVLKTDLIKSGSPEMQEPKRRG